MIDHCTSDNLLYLMKTIQAFDINIGIRSWFTFHDKHLADLKDWDGDL